MNHAFAQWKLSLPLTAVTYAPLKILLGVDQVRNLGLCQYSVLRWPTLKEIFSFTDVDGSGGNL